MNFQYFTNSFTSAFSNVSQGQESTMLPEQDIEDGQSHDTPPLQSQHTDNPVDSDVLEEAKSLKGWHKAAVQAAKNLLGATGTAIGGIFGSLKGRVGAALGAFGGAAFAELISTLIEGLTASRNYKDDMEKRCIIIEQVFKKSTFDIIKTSLAALPTAILPILVTEKLVENWTNHANMTMDDCSNMTFGQADMFNLTTAESSMYNLTAAESAMQMGAAGITSALTNFVALLILRAIGKIIYSRYSSETPDSAEFNKEEILKDFQKFMIAIPSDLATAGAAATIGVNFAAHLTISTIVSSTKTSIESKRRRILREKVKTVFSSLIQSVKKMKEATTATKTASGHAPLIRRGTIHRIMMGNAALKTSLSTPELRKLKKKAHKLKTELSIAVTTPITSERRFEPWQIPVEEMEVTGQGIEAKIDEDSPIVHDGRDTPESKRDPETEITRVQMQLAEEVVEEISPIPLNIAEITPVSIVDIVRAVTESQQRSTATGSVSDLTPPLTQRSPLPMRAETEIELDDEGFPIIAIDFDHLPDETFDVDASLPEKAQSPMLTDFSHYTKEEQEQMFQGKAPF
ncbi:MAG: hypothetical protein S4CHLAM20_07120 [Chlamydiia bacterium]|nr:hypothetical protein [Chlamydiia bacterium]